MRLLKFVPMTMLWLPACSYMDGDLTCNTVTPEECSDRKDCSTITGLEIWFANGEWCLDTAAEPDPLGCHDATSTCDDVESWATPETGGDCFFFTNSCVPSGWVECEAEQQTNIPCLFDQ